MTRLSIIALLAALTVLYPAAAFVARKWTLGHYFARVAFSQLQSQLTNLYYSLFSFDSATQPQPTAEAVEAEIISKSTPVSSGRQ
jgi:hypothetical protein